MINYLVLSRKVFNLSIFLIPILIVPVFYAVTVSHFLLFMASMLYLIQTKNLHTSQTINFYFFICTSFFLALFISGIFSDSLLNHSLSTLQYFFTYLVVPYIFFIFRLQITKAEKALVYGTCLVSFYLFLYVTFDFRDLIPDYLKIRQYGSSSNNNARFSVGSPSDMGFLFYISFAILFNLFFNSKNKFLNIILICIVTYGLLMADSRGSYIAIIFFITSYIMLSDNFPLSFRLFGLFCIFLLFFIFLESGVSRLNFDTLGNSFQSIRFAQYDFALSLINESDLFPLNKGIGSYSSSLINTSMEFGSTIKMMMQYNLNDQMILEASKPHNIFLILWSETGLLSTLLFLILNLYVATLALISKQRKFLFSIFIGYFIYIQFFTHTYQLIFIIPIALIIAKCSNILIINNGENYSVK